MRGDYTHGVRDKELHEGAKKRVRMRERRVIGARTRDAWEARGGEARKSRGEEKLEKSREARRAPILARHGARDRARGDRRGEKGRAEPGCLRQPPAPPREKRKGEEGRRRRGRLTESRRSAHDMREAVAATMLYTRGAEQGAVRGCEEARESECEKSA